MSAVEINLSNAVRACSFLLRKYFYSSFILKLIFVVECVGLRYKALSLLLRIYKRVCIACSTWPFTHCKQWLLNAKTRCGRCSRHWNGSYSTAECFCCGPNIFFISIHSQWHFELDETSSSYKCNYYRCRYIVSYTLNMVIMWLSKQLFHFNIRLSQ